MKKIGMALLMLAIPVAAYAVKVGDSQRARVHADSAAECNSYNFLGGSSTLSNGQGGQLEGVLGGCQNTASGCFCNIHVVSMPYGGIPGELDDYTWNIID